MLVISRVIANIVLPPSIIIVILVILLIMIKMKKDKTATKIVYFIILVTYFISSIIGEYFLVKPLEIKNNTVMEEREIRTPKEIAIVILAGGAIKGTVIGNAELGNITLSRLYGGYKIHKKYGYDICVSGDWIDDNNDITVADMMRDVLLDLNVDYNNIILETRSRNTWENAVESLEILRDSGYKQIILVTSALHMPRSIYSFQKVAPDLTIIASPTDFIYYYETRKWLPNTSSLHNNLLAIHEWIGLIWYNLRY